jgi:hypothetical protein
MAATVQILTSRFVLNVQDTAMRLHGERSICPELPAADRSIQGGYPGSIVRPEFSGLVRHYIPETSDG